VQQRVKMVASLAALSDPPPLITPEWHAVATMRVPLAHVLHSIKAIG
jgi:hypothetical protein